MKLCNDCNRQPGNQIRLKFRAAITFAQDGDQLGSEKFSKARRCLMLLRSVGCVQLKSPL
ncbi:hypothetical protein DEV91_12911 [Phyllobacterium brassicacearum]|nr:hypothetical protein DEV91_12911 [Phyllobacterium brassicacearum]